MVPYIERGAAFTQSVGERERETTAPVPARSVRRRWYRWLRPRHWRSGRLLASPLTSDGVAREMLVVLRVSPITGKGVCPGVSMSRQAAQSDAHMKRIASDADHWRNRLERFAELRRASEPKATGLAFRESSPLVEPSAIVLHHQDQGAET
jgi:hypothetical protein